MPIGMHPIEIIFLLVAIFWFWMLVDCILNKYLRDTQKVLWFLLIFFTSILGAILYFLFGRSKKNGPYQPSQPYYTPQSQPYQPYTPNYPAQPSSPANHTDSHSYQSYSQGYQTAQTPPPYQPGAQPVPPDQSPYEQYEQPRAAYPEQSQQDNG